jgi:4-methylaminobutanoate oxidase (formaldehyde-forming)
MGPGSRSFLAQALRDTDLSHEAFPFGANRAVEIGCAPARATRVSYVGELGWELYVPVDMARHAFDHLMEHGVSHELTLAGMHALNSCRIEKKFVHYGHDIADEDTPLEAGMGFVCALDKGVDWIGREAIARQKESRGHLQKRLVQFLLEDPEATLYHHEPIWRDGVLVGHLTSGDYGHTLGGAVGLGYVKRPEAIDAEFIRSGTWEIEVACERVPAKASLQALYDPKAQRMRS